MPTDNKPVYTTRSSLERVKRVCDRVEGRAPSGPGQKRTRHVAAGGGGGGEAATAFTLGRVTAEISAASNNLIEAWGTGTIALLDPATGAATETTIGVVNPWNIVFAVDAMVETTSSAEGATVRNGTCGAFPWVAEV